MNDVTVEITPGWKRLPVRDKTEWLALQRPGLAAAFVYARHYITVLTGPAPCNFLSATPSPGIRHEKDSS